jgi:hypothetical protein
MARLLRTCVLANLALAIVMVLGYAVFLLNQDDPLPDQFLGYSTWTERLSLLFAVLNGMAIVALFLWRRFLLLNQTPTRIACVFFGLWGLSFTAVLPALKSQVYGESMLTLDNALGWYVWSAHLLFGLVGSNDRLAIGDRDHVPQP